MGFVWSTTFTELQVNDTSRKDMRLNNVLSAIRRRRPKFVILGPTILHTMMFAKSSEREQSWKEMWYFWKMLLLECKRMREIKFVLPAVEPLVMDSKDENGWHFEFMASYIRRWNIQLRELIGILDAPNVEFMEAGLHTMYHPYDEGRPLVADKVHFLARMAPDTPIPGKLFADVQILMNHFCRKN